MRAQPPAGAVRVKATPVASPPGSAVTGFDAEQLRYTCDLGGGKVLGLALDKVILPAGARCRVVGLTSAAGSKWNDHIGKVVEYDRVAGRYLLQLGGGNQLHIKPANARL